MQAKEGLAIQRLPGVVREPGGCGIPRGCQRSVLGTITAGRACTASPGLGRRGGCWGASPDRLPAVLGTQLLASPSTQADWPVLVGEGAVQARAPGRLLGERSSALGSALRRI